MIKGPIVQCGMPPFGARMRHRAGRLALSVALAVLIIVVPGMPAVGGRQQAKEHEIKGAFVFNFAKFVTWPENAFEDDTSPVIIGILGKSTVSSYLENTAAVKTLGSRAMRVRLMESADIAADSTVLETCHILFVSASATGNAGKFLGSLREHPVLTVGETEGILDAGGIIEFYQDGDKIRFRVNITAAKTANLEISSKLLKLADVRK